MTNTYNWFFHYNIWFVITDLEILIEKGILSQDDINKNIVLKPNNQWNLFLFETNKSNIKLKIWWLEINKKMKSNQIVLLSPSLCEYDLLMDNIWWDIYYNRELQGDDTYKFTITFK
jgi:hypothetical protein